MQKLIYVPMEVNAYEVDLLVVGDFPNETDEIQGRPFLGAPGKLLRDTLTACGADFARVAVTNVVKVRPDGNRTPTPDEVHSWLHALWADLTDTAPIHVVAVGKVAHRAIRLLSDRMPGVGLHFLNSPAYVLRNPEKEEQWKAQISEIVSLCSTSKLSSSNRMAQNEPLQNSIGTPFESTVAAFRGETDQD